MRACRGAIVDASSSTAWQSTAYACAAPGCMIAVPVTVAAGARCTTTAFDSEGNLQRSGVRRTPLSLMARGRATTHTPALHITAGGPTYTLSASCSGAHTDPDGNIDDALAESSCTVAAGKPMTDGSMHCRRGCMPIVLLLLPAVSLNHCPRRHVPNCRSAVTKGGAAHGSARVIVPLRPPPCLQTTPGSKNGGADGDGDGRAGDGLGEATACGVSVAAELREGVAAADALADADADGDSVEVSLTDGDELVDEVQLAEGDGDELAETDGDGKTLDEGLIVIDGDVVVVQDGLADGVTVAVAVDVVEAVPVELAVIVIEGVVLLDNDAEPVAVAVGTRIGGAATPLNWYIGEVTASSVHLPMPLNDQSNRYNEPPMPAFHVVTYIAYAVVSLRHVIA